MSAELPRLRAYERSDEAAMFGLFADPLVMRYVGNGEALDGAGVASLLEKILDIYRTDPQFHVWAIEDDGGYVGHAELKRRRGRSEYELIYFLRAAAWGRGLGSRVVDRLLEEARALQLPFVVATVDPRNGASIAILERRGFTPDAQLSEELGAQAYRLELIR